MCQDHSAKAKSLSYKALYPPLSHISCLQETWRREEGAKVTLRPQNGIKGGVEVLPSAAGYQVLTWKESRDLRLASQEPNHWFRERSRSWLKVRLALGPKGDLD